MYSKKLFVKFISFILLFNVFADSAMAKHKDLYYLSSSGYLIKLDVDNIAETGQVAAGSLPWSAASCDGHIYFTDFGSDQLFDFSPGDKVLNKVKLDDPENTFAVQEIELITPPDQEIKKTPIQRAFEKVHRPKPKPATFDPIGEPLEVANHNKKLGIGSVACNQNYVFVVTTLKNRVEVLSRSDLKRVASFKVGERPSHVAVSPNGKTVAISSTGVNKVYLADANSFAKQAEIDVQEGPTEITWLNDKQVFVLNRGDNSISAISSNALQKTVDFSGTGINAIVAFPGENRIYALDGSEKKLHVVDASSYTYETKEVNPSLKFPSLLQKIEDNELLVGSEPDGRFVVLNTQSFETLKKIQTNLPPKTIVRLINDYETVNLKNSTPIASEKIANEKKAEVTNFYPQDKTPAKYDEANI